MRHPAPPQPTGTAYLDTDVTGASNALPAEQDDHAASADLAHAEPKEAPSGDPDAAGEDRAAHRQTGHPGADRRGAAQQLRAEVAARIDAALGARPEPAATPTPETGDARQGERDDAARAPVTDVYVGWHAAMEARTCPTRYRAQGEDGWGFPGWSAPTASAAIGRAALDHHLRAHDRLPGQLGRPVPLPAPLTAVRTWMQTMGKASDSGIGDWVAERMSDDDDATLAAAATGATRWIAGFVRVLGWPLPDRLTLLTSSRQSPTPPLRWRPGRHSPVTVASGADARWGRVSQTGDFAVVVHRVSAGEDGRVRDRAAFEATAAALAVGVVPAQILLTAGDTGERLRVTVDDGLLALGTELVTGVVHQRVLAMTLGPDTADATPSPACRHCPQLAECDPGEAWLAGPGRWRGGLPVL